MTTVIRATPHIQDLRDAVRATTGHTRIVIDLTDVPQLQATHLRLIETVRRRTAARDGWVRVATPCPAAQDALTDALAWIPIYDTVHDALTARRAPRPLP